MKRLYIGNLAYRATEANLAEWFQQRGVTASAVTIMRDQFSGESRGFGFAEVAETELDRAVKASEGHALMGRSIVVKEAMPLRNSSGQTTPAKADIQAMRVPAGDFTRLGIRRLV